MDSLLTNTIKYLLDLCHAYQDSKDSKPKELPEPAFGQAISGYLNNLNALVIWGLSNMAWVTSLTRVADNLANSQFDGSEKKYLETWLNTIEQGEKPDQTVLELLDNIRNRQNIPVPVRSQS